MSNTALDALRNLSQKKPVASNTSVSPQIGDPAIAGASRGKSKTTVTLGFDPNFAERASYAAALKGALEQAEADYATAQSAVRDYGREKRDKYNDAYKSEVLTVCIPYNVETPTGHEKKLVQVTCSRKWSVDQPSILANKDTFGEHYPRLFSEEVTTKLKPNAEELIRKVFEETAGLQGEQLDNVMEQLLDKTTKVSCREDYEAESKRIPENLRSILDQTITRAAPALKFDI